jgi:hypothetical protein
VEITLEPADGDRAAITTFGRLGTTWTLGNVRPGGRYRAPVSPPDPFGGRSWLVCHCVADDDEVWSVRTWVDAAWVGANVSWEIDSPAKDTYRLHNTSTERATGVHINFGPLDRGLVHNLPDPAQVEAGGYVEFHAFLSLDQVPELAEVWVRWDGCERPASVSMP